MSEKTPVYLAQTDWETIVRELRDSRKQMLETERDFGSYPRVANAARVEAERIGATIERVLSQVTVEES